MQIYSIFKSINGEVGNQGMFTTFVRFAGCMKTPCKWCDTKYAISPTSGITTSPREVVYKIESISAGWPHVTITGGEPLMQRESLKELLHLLWERSKIVSVETNGVHDIFASNISYLVKHWIVDYKTPSSGISHKMYDPMFILLEKSDWVKMVISDSKDYEFAKERMHYFIKEGCQATFAFSPMSYGEVTPSLLMNWLIEDNLFNVVLNLQLHKLASLDESK